MTPEEFAKDRAKRLTFIRRLYDAGCPDRAAARILGLSPHHIRQWRNERGLPIVAGALACEPNKQGRFALWETKHQRLIEQICREFNELD